MVGSIDLVSQCSVMRLRNSILDTNLFDPLEVVFHIPASQKEVDPGSVMRHEISICTRFLETTRP
ncbi:hypothetical protein [Mesorhizobium sp. RMAD-H1]|uniref:hypothetical protein n=1 Tax=Mesorhizobium sp. RMAD-H1 TaxID=2587065 RepID=UPI00161DBA80|nr:hypothetical protein [Mesorhizobium sp. RMAD-H1]MBB2973281.1 hypothetical protein [Mesorhizobium sp. RMAD-H1]